jgi:hypothetical protein
VTTRRGQGDLRLTRQGGKLRILGEGKFNREFPELLPIYDGSYTNKRACCYSGDTTSYADKGEKNGMRA